MHGQTQLVSLEPADHASRPRSRVNASVTTCGRGLCHGISSRVRSAQTARPGAVVPGAHEAVAIGACCSAPQAPHTAALFNHFEYQNTRC
jgi:hypothetical protein